MTAPETGAILSRVESLHEDVREMRRESVEDHRAVRLDLAALTKRVEMVETADQAEAARAASRRRLCRQFGALIVATATTTAAVVSVLLGTGILP